jgi:hypothetical protein
MDLSLLKMAPVARLLPTAAILLLYSMASVSLSFREIRAIMGLHPMLSPREATLYQYALTGLNRIHDQRELDTVVSNRKNVLEKCFPMNWEPGTLQNAFKRKEESQANLPGVSVNKKFRIVLVGGSASSMGPLNCQVGDDPLWGLYSRMLERGLNNEDDYGVRKEGDPGLVQFEVTNMAQGDTDSGQNAVLLDRYIDPHNTDLLIHEFGINLHPQGKDIQETGLNLWLASVDSLFAAAGRRVPPLIIMQFWRDRQALFTDEMREQGLDYSTLDNQWDVINYYRDVLGWEIQVINVAPGIDGKVAADDVTIVFDDGHHQSCLVSRLISAMIQQAIFSNLKTIESPDSKKELTADESLPLPPLQHWCKLHLVHDPFYCAFIDAPSKGARMGSLSPWLPNTGTSNLNFLSNTTASYTLMDHKIVNPMPSYPNRADRKEAWELSPCLDDTTNIDISTLSDLENDRILQFTLMEPDLKWLAFYLDNFQGSAKFRVRINGVPIDFKRDHPQSYHPLGRLRAILHIPDLVPPAPYYTFSFCMRNDQPVEIEEERHGWLHYLAAVVQETKQEIVPFY